MDIDNIIGKVTGNADKLGLLLGVTTGSSAGFADLTSTIENIMAGNIHPPNLQAALSSYAAEGFGKAGVMVAVLGYIIKEINLNPTLNKIGDVAQKGGIGYALGSLISKLLWESTHSAAWRNEQDVTQEQANKWLAQPQEIYV